MDTVLRKLQTVVSNKLSDAVASRRSHLEALQFEINRLLQKFLDPEFDRTVLYRDVAALLILIDQAGLLR